MPEKKEGRETNFLKKVQWSPYVAGALIGVVSWFSVLTAGKYLGVSTTFVHTIGMVESIFFLSCGWYALFHERKARHRLAVDGGPWDSHRCLYFGKTLGGFQTEIRSTHVGSSL